MKYKGIVEITLRPEMLDDKQEALTILLKRTQSTTIEYDVGSVRLGKVFEIEFECEPTDAPDILEHMCQQLTHPIFETYGYRLSFVGQEGYGETSMRYRVGHYDIQQCELRGKYPIPNNYEIVRAEWWVKDHKTVLLRYEYKGLESTFGIRLDMTTRKFLDGFDDPEATAALNKMTELIFAEIVFGMKPAPYTV